jgi:hypothetical protein
MVKKKEVVDQTSIAFDHIQKLYYETSYLIKEIEGLLREEKPEEFIIGKPSGYGISSLSSTGIESSNVNNWLLRKFSVFFVSANNTKESRGRTNTPITHKLKIIYARIILNDSKIKEPKIQLGVLYDIKKKESKFKKFEECMGHFEYNDSRFEKKGNLIEFDSAYISLRGEIREYNLFDISDSSTLKNKIIDPFMKLYRSK